MLTRYEERQKKRKQQVILNTLIVIVVLGIVIVGIQLLLGHPNQSPVSKETPITKNDGEQNDFNRVTEQGDIDVRELEETSPETEPSEPSVVNGNGGSPEGPWEPIGTKQTGEHVTRFEKGTLDWEEMTLALAYGAGIPYEDMTIHWLGNGGQEQRAKGRVTNKDEPDKTYHITLEWVDEQGWKPIEVLIEG